MPGMDVNAAQQPQRLHNHAAYTGVFSPYNYNQHLNLILVPLAIHRLPALVSVLHIEHIWLIIGNKAAIRSLDGFHGQLWAFKSLS